MCDGLGVREARARGVLRGHRDNDIYYVVIVTMICSNRRLLSQYLEVVRERRAPPNRGCTHWSHVDNLLAFIGLFFRHNTQAHARAAVSFCTLQEEGGRCRAAILPEFSSRDSKHF